MKQERPGHTLQTYALVNEAYRPLVDWKNAEWRNRAHFFGMFARTMRQILVDHARKATRKVAVIDRNSLLMKRRSFHLRRARRRRP